MIWRIASTRVVLPGAGFAGDADDLVAVNRERGAIDDPRQAALGDRKWIAEILDFEQWHILFV